MNRKWIAVTVACTLLVLGTATLSFAKYGKGRAGQGPLGMLGFGGERAIAEMETRLKLTPEQSQQVRQILTGQREKMFEDFGAGRENRQALVREIFKDNPNQAEIQKRVAALQQRHAEMLKQVVATGLEINKVITPEQRTELNKVIEERMLVGEKMRERFRERRGQPAPQND